MANDLEIPDLPTADMLEIFASGGNGSEYVDAHWLLNKAATELREAAIRIEELEKALEPFANAYVNREKWAEDMYIGGSALRNSDLLAAARAYKGE